jgi:hypothetical protein
MAEDAENDEEDGGDDDRNKSSGGDPDFDWGSVLGKSPVVGRNPLADSMDLTKSAGRQSSLADLPPIAF